ncbi:MAG: hypothetical protein JW753_04440 [Dehalococcoidia bacterium]|nr:hypothetical protein [Dehalococcoidia bacterium]
MTKSKVSFALIMTLVVVSLLMLMLPAGAVAAPGIVEKNWSESAFEGYDTFYASDVVAYTAGSTAKFEFRVNNDGGTDLKITGASLVFDWGTCAPVTPTTFPFVLPAHNYASFRFECVVPADATNQTLHTYTAIVNYEGDNGPSKVSEVYWEDVPGGGVTYGLNHTPIVPDSEVIYLEDTAANTVNALGLNSGYAINDYTGVITFTAAPTANVRAKYKYTEAVFTGDGSTLVGYLDHAPVVDGSWVVCRVDTVAETITVLTQTTDYTVDPSNGKVTMVTAPAAYQVIRAYYQYYNRFTTSGSIAVVSADQETYTMNWRRYNETYNTYWLSIYSGEALQLGGQAEQARAQAEIEYREGNFAEANATMQTALNNLNAAIAAEAAFQTTIGTGLTALLSGGGEVIDAYGAKLNAEAQNITDLTDAQVKKLKGEASKAANTGVFYIMLGVFTLLVGIAAVLWGLGQFMGARAQKSQGP